MTTYKFEDAKDMLLTIQSGIDLYDPKTGKYIWLYNNSGSIACGDISEEKLKEVGHAMAEAEDDSLVYEHLYGQIYDDPSYDGFNPQLISNLEFCADNYKAEWFAASEYIRLSKVICGCIEVDVELTPDGYDTYISHDGNSGLHYVGKTAEEIGRIVAEEIDMYAEGGQAGIDEDKRIPIPQPKKPAILAFTDGINISYVKHPSLEAAQEALKAEYQRNFSDLYDENTPEEDISSEQDMSYYGNTEAKLYTGETVLVWQIIEV